MALKSLAHLFEKPLTQIVFPIEREKHVYHYFPHLNVKQQAEKQQKLNKTLKKTLKNREKKKRKRLKQTTNTNQYLDSHELIDDDLSLVLPKTKLEKTFKRPRVNKAISKSTVKQEYMAHDLLGTLISDCHNVPGEDNARIMHGVVDNIEREKASKSNVSGVGEINQKRISDSTHNKLKRRVSAISLADKEQLIGFRTHHKLETTRETSAEDRRIKKEFDSSQVYLLEDGEIQSDSDDNEAIKAPHQNVNVKEDDGSPSEGSGKRVGAKFDELENVVTEKNNDPLRTLQTSDGEPPKSKERPTGDNVITNVFAQNLAAKSDSPKRCLLKKSNHLCPPGVSCEDEDSIDDDDDDSNLSVDQKHLMRQDLKIDNLSLSSNMVNLEDDKINNSVFSKSFNDFKSSPNLAFPNLNEFKKIFAMNPMGFKPPNFPTLPPEHLLGFQKYLQANNMPDFSQIKPERFPKSSSSIGKMETQETSTQVKKVSDSPPRKKPKHKSERQKALSRSFLEKRKQDKVREDAKREHDKNVACPHFKKRGQCDYGDSCRFSHDITVDKKLSLCKFYVADACREGDTCLFMHSTWPCKFFHVMKRCNYGDDCKYSHSEMTKEIRDVFETFEANTNAIVEGPTSTTDSSVTASTESPRSVPSESVSSKPVSSEPVSSEPVSSEPVNSTSEGFQFPSLYYEL